MHLGANQINWEIVAVVRVPGPRNREELEPVSNRAVARDAKTSAEMTSSMMEACKGAPQPCPDGSWLTADASAHWSDATNALGAIVAAQRNATRGGPGVMELQVSFRPRGNRPLGEQPPAIRMGATSVSGRLPPSEIQRVMRENFGAFRTCYESGLKKNPDLKGRVALRFVIDRDGHVSHASEDLAHTPADQQMPDEQVKACIVNALRGLEFPQPEGGIVTVVYPIMFSAGD